MYDNGRGVKTDTTKAFSYYQLAANQGHVGAQVNLGCMYGNGRGVAIDEIKALLYFQEAGAPWNAGDAQEQFNIGNMYVHGRGVKKNKVKTLEWFSRAAKQGHTQAQDQIAAHMGTGDRRLEF